MLLIINDKKVIVARVGNCYYVVCQRIQPEQLQPEQDSQKGALPPFFYVPGHELFDDLDLEIINQFPEAERDSIAIDIAMMKKAVLEVKKQLMDKGVEEDIAELQALDLVEKDWYRFYKGSLI